MKENKKILFQRFRNNFMSGLLALGPIYLSLLFIFYLVRLTDQLVVNPLFQVLPFDIESRYKVALAKLIISVFVIFFITLIGFTARRLITKQIALGWEQFLKSIPFFKNIYSSIREVADAFFGDKRSNYSKVVFLEYPRKGIYAMGFVTQDKRWEIHEKTGKEILNVFVPSPPNPATGNFVFVPKEELIESDMTVEEGIRIVMSGGAAVPPIRQK